MIKLSKTKSEIVRKVAPGQPMTMDYRSNRVTVTIDPTSKKLLKQHVVNSLIKELI